MIITTSLGFTGTKEGMTHQQATKFIKFARHFIGEFHNGWCVGADEEAAKVIDNIGGYVIHSHPPINKKYFSSFHPKHCEFRVHKAKPYDVRDLDIVIDSNIMVATPRGFTEIKRGSGTWLTI